MTRVHLRITTLLVATATVVVSCTDRPAPTAPAASAIGRRIEMSSSACLSLNDLTALMKTVFGEGSPNVNSALSKLNTITSKLEQGDTTGAQEHAKTLITFIRQKANELPGRAQVQALIDAIECYVGLPADTFLIYPGDTAQTIVSGNGQSGMKLPANPVSEPTLITLTSLDPSTSPLLTKLDQYPAYVDILQESNVGNSLVTRVVVAVCPVATVPSDVRARLRLGHQSATNGFEITPSADGSFLTCSNVASARSRLPGWVRSFASIVLPRPLYASMWLSGGVGGTATEFSPFGPVDSQLSFSGGVGGTATEFLRMPESEDPDRKMPGTPGKRPRVMNSTEAVVGLANIVVCGEAVVGSALPAECRPRVELKTANGTIMQNVPVTFAIGLGGGSTAVDDPTTRACGAFGDSASTTTNVNGKAGACWTMGPVAGPNTLIATPHAGGDAPSGVTFSPANNTFTVQGIKATATLTLGGLNQTYDGTAKSVTVTTAPAGLDTVKVTYDGSATAPTAAGSYAVVATLDNPSWEGTATGTLTIAKASQAALSVVSPAATITYAGGTATLSTTGGSGSGAVSFDAGTSTACSVTVAGVVTATSGTGTCSITATKAGDANYDAATSAPLALTVAKADQAITFGALNAKTFGDPAFTVSATANSSLAVTFAAGAGDQCTVAGSTVTIAGAGSCTVTASQAGDANYNAAPPVSQTFAIAKATQPALSVSGPSAATWGAGTVALSTTGGEGTGAISYASTTPSSCTVDANTGVVSVLIGTGSCVITVDKAGDANWNAAAQVTKSIALNKADQSIIGFTTPSSMTYGDAAAAVSASATSGLAVSFSLLAGSNCTLAGNLVTPTGAGTCTVVVSQNGNADYYNAAVSLSSTFGIAKHGATATSGSATINFGAAVPATPCTVTGLLAPDAGSVTCTTIIPMVTTAGAYSFIPSVSPADPANYAMTLVNGTLTVAAYVQVGCFSSPIYSVMPPTKSSQKKGSNVPVKCALTTPEGTPVMTATGDLLVQDMGTTGASAPTTAFSGTNVFKVSGGGNYAYGLDTSPATFVSGHYYLVTATWKDGSKTTGWFYIR